jgi:type I restriction enzyme S subunit
MMGHLQPYPRYKTVGVPWVDAVPSHWDIVQIRHIGRFLKGVGGTKEDSLPSGIPCVRYGELYTTHSYFIRNSKAYVSEERAESYTPIAFGDVLFAASGEKMEEIGKSAVNLLQTRAVCGGDVIILRPTISVHSPFLGYALDCYPSASQKATMGRGTTIKHIYPGELKCLLFPFPSFDEQIAIARFLERADEKLDRAIRAKRKVIALLNEQKRAIIHRAVTCGLDPSAALKSSGIPWIGDIPSHWRVRRAKYIWREVDDKSADGCEELLSVSHITGVTPRSQKNITMFKAASYSGHRMCRPADLVVNTMWAWMGALGISEYTGIISPAYAVYRPQRPDDIVGEYIDGLLRSRPYISNIICRSTGLRPSRLRLYPDEFLRLAIILPPAEEQKRIVAFIRTETAELNTAILRLQREIELLSEYKLRLIADVVTGKLDVRQAAAALPDEDLNADNVGTADSVEADEEGEEFAEEVLAD